MHAKQNTPLMMVLCVVLAMVCTTGAAQSITGTLPLLANQPISLEGFRGLSTTTISAVTVDENGQFTLPYSLNDYGVAYLISADDKPFIVMLSGEDIALNGEALSMPETMHVINGEQNLLFERYAREQPKREQALTAWVYLERMYNSDSLFSVNRTPVTAIHTEMQRLRADDAAFLASLPHGSYVQWFLPVRKLVSSVSTIAQYRPEEVQATINAFRSLDHADNRLYRSGLLRDAIEGHYWLLENSGNPLDTIVVMMQRSIDVLVDQLLSHDDLLNEITNYLFDLLERHSLFGASEHLALRLLNENGCTLDTDFARQLEIYRAMRPGKTAADIEFTGERIQNAATPNNAPGRLSEITSNYVVVVFAASWCQTCTEELPQLVKLYPKWRAAGVEVVLISLDDQAADFQRFVGAAPFLSVCDFKKWEGQAVHDYYVFGTPSLFLLDADRRIVLRPNSVKHADSWVAWNLMKQ